MGDWSIVAIVGLLCFTWLIWWTMWWSFKYTQNTIIAPPAEKPAQEKVQEIMDTAIHPSEADTGIWPQDQQ